MEVKRVDGHAGEFSLGTPLEGHPAGTLVQVTVSAADPSRLALNFSDHHPVLTNACALSCGHVGALELLELGYTGPLVRRPRLAAIAHSNASHPADAGGLTTELVHRK
jgi:hypothetical protein